MRCSLLRQNLLRSVLRRTVKPIQHQRLQRGIHHERVAFAGAMREKREDRQKRGGAHQKLVHVLHGRMAGGKATVDQHGQRPHEGERVKAKG